MWLIGTKSPLRRVETGARRGLLLADVQRTPHCVYQAFDEHRQSFGVDLHIVRFVSADGSPVVAGGAKSRGGQVVFACAVFTAFFRYERRQFAVGLRVANAFDDFVRSAGG